jgi:hypothetical protein
MPVVITFVCRHRDNSIVTERAWVRLNTSMTKPQIGFTTFVQLGFSSNITSDKVTLTNFVKNFNFCGRLYFDSLVAKPLSDLYTDSSSNFQSND